jgi:hypothetical protein
VLIAFFQLKALFYLRSGARIPNIPPRTQQASAVLHRPSTDLFTVPGAAAGLTAAG